MTAGIKFNTSSLIKHHEVVQDGGLPPLGTYDKNLSFRKAREYGEYVNKVLDVILALESFLEQDKTFTCIDIKYMALKPNDATCGVTGWHCDGNTYPFRGNRYFILNSNPTTEMMDSEIELPAYEGIPQKELVALANDNEGSFLSIDPYTIYEYGCDRFHRGAIATEESNRLLIRVCCTNYIRPN